MAENGRVIPDEQTLTRLRIDKMNPCLIVRSLLHKLGYRFRLQKKNLPGSPDIILPKYKTAVFVYSCFWHRHSNCSYAHTPSTNTEYWQKRFAGIAAEDRNIESQMSAIDWKVLIVFKCETVRMKKLAIRLSSTIC